MVHLQMDHYDLARPHLEQCVSMLREDGDQERIADNLYWLGYALANTGDLDLAEQAFDESRKLFIEINPERVSNVDETLSRLRDVIRQQDS
jgi:tetratricopeptide (TPR) repeat protein